MDPLPIPLGGSALGPDQDDAAAAVPALILKRGAEQVGVDLDGENLLRNERERQRLVGRQGKVVSVDVIGRRTVVGQRRIEDLALAPLELDDVSHPARPEHDAGHQPEDLLHAGRTGLRDVALVQEVSLQRLPALLESDGGQVRRRGDLDRLEDLHRIAPGDLRPPAARAPPAPSCSVNRPWGSASTRASAPTAETAAPATSEPLRFRTTPITVPVALPVTSSRSARPKGCPARSRASMPDGPSATWPRISTTTSVGMLHSTTRPELSERAVTTRGSQRFAPAPMMVNAVHSAVTGTSPSGRSFCPSRTQPSTTPVSCRGSWGQSAAWTEAGLGVARMTWTVRPPSATTSRGGAERRVESRTGW